jgi:CRP-like cAMP-binding protein
MPQSNHALIRSLEFRDELNDAERSALSQLPGRKAKYSRGEDIVAEGSKPTESCLMTAGFSARSQLLMEGTRQFTALHIPGDFVDLHSFTLKVMDHSVVAVSDCETLFVSHSRLEGIVKEFPHLGRLLWLLTTVDGAIQRAWITCLGRRSSSGHLAHLLCEVYIRQEVAGLARDNVFDFPVTQAELADFLGLSVVHVNRTLRDLRSAGYIAWQGNVVTILDPEGLKAHAEFDPTYLNLIKERR